MQLASLRLEGNSRLTFKRQWLRFASTLNKSALLAFATVFGLSISSLPTVSQGQAEESDQAKLEAIQHFNRAVELYQEGSLEAALVEFELTYELYPSYKLLYNLAQLQSDWHQYVAALELYRRYLAEGGDRIDAERRELVTEEISRLRMRVGSLWVTSEQEGAELFIDGKSVALLPLPGPILVNSGMREFRLVKEGFVPSEGTLKIAGGDQLRVNLPMIEKPKLVALPPVQEPTPLAEPTPVPVAPAIPDERADHTPFFISIVLAGALTAGAATLGVITSVNDRRLDDALGEYPANIGAVNRQRSRTRTYATITDGLVLGAAAMAGVALYFLLDPPTETLEPAPSRVQAWLTPAGVAGHF